MPEPVYVGRLAKELRSAEDELQQLRPIRATITRFLNNPAIALDIRQNLARDLHLPTPEK